jgi:hypothetical protein
MKYRLIEEVVDRRWFRQGKDEKRTALPNANSRVIPPID